MGVRIKKHVLNVKLIVVWFIFYLGVNCGQLSLTH